MKAAILRMALSALLVAGHSAAQVDELRLFPTTEDASTETESVDGVATDAEPTPVDTPELRAERAKALLAETRGVTLLRPTTALLSGMAERSTPPAEFFARVEQHLSGAELAEGDKALTPADVADQFTRWYTAGDWQDMQHFLTLFDEAVATEIFDQILKLGINDKVILLADEILAIADVAPVAPDDDQIEKLGTMLAKAGKLSGRPDGVIAALHAGSSRHLGGKDADARRRAARLLIDAKMPVDAVAFLPSLDSALEDNDGEAINLYAKAFFVRGSIDGFGELAQKAWDLSHTVLTTGKKKPAEDAASALADEWSSREPREALDWQARLVDEHPKRAFLWFGALEKKLEEARKMKETAPRIAWLGVLDELAAALGARPMVLDGTVTAMSVLTRAWLDEAYYTLDGVPLTTPNHSAKSPDAYALTHAKAILTAREKKKADKIEAEQLLALQPHATWLDLIDAETRARVGEAEAALAAHALDLGATLQAIASADPVDARILTDRLLTRWIAKRDLNAGRTRYSWYWSRSYSDNIPLTRAKQRRNLDELGSLLERLRSSGAPRPSATLITEAFAASHSPAEVYRKSDIERIFGSFDEMPLDLAAALTNNLREKLIGQWRSKDVQRDQETRRTDDDLALEIERGYDVGTRLLDNVAARELYEPGVAVSLAALLFDYAEFMYGQEADLDTYAALRDRSFASFADAARRNTRASTARSAWTHFAWFQAALGASDLGQLTRQVDPDKNQIALIATALRQAPAEQRDALFASFGESLVTTAATVPPQLKPRYFRHGLEILGDDVSGAEARELLDYYDDLLEEIELAVVVDGSTDIGHGTPFGAHVLMRSTRELAREADAFRFLVKNNVYNRSSTRVDHRDELATQIREAFSEAFEVHAVTFHAEDVKPMGFGRTGWQQTPIAYVALTARDPSVDRIPELQIDLDFADAKGSVLLPVSSKVVLVDARSDTPQPRPVRSLHALITLDDRNLETEGHARLEVSITSTGLVPAIDTLLDTDVPGFTLTDIETHEMDVVEMGGDDELLAPICNQSWTLLYTPDDDERVESFTFPVVADGSGTRVATTREDDEQEDDVASEPAVAGPLGVVTYTYQRYADADIVDVETQSVDITPIGSDRPWALILGLLILASGAIGFLLWRRRPDTETEHELRYETPTSVTAFSSVTLLRRIARDDEVRLSDDEREELTTAIGDIEVRYFANGTPTDETSSDTELRRTVHRWLNVTRRP